MLSTLPRSREFFLTDPHHGGTNVFLLHPRSIMFSVKFYTMYICAIRKAKMASIAL